nr:RecName: Full=Omega-oxotoxin-Ol1a; Short=Omega-OXTX-Ol1a; AltName: Full=Oxytoxin-1; Short=OxyTx1 [Oxyopes lineatus]
DWECLPLHSSCDNDCVCCKNHHCHCPYSNVSKLEKWLPEWAKIPDALKRCSCQRNDKDGKINTCDKYKN